MEDRGQTLFSQNGYGIAEIDRLSADVVSGWACYRTDRQRRVILEVIVDGKIAGTTIASNFRPDLKELEISDGYSGFQFQFPDSYFDNQSHAIIVQEQGTKLLLTREPTILFFEKKNDFHRFSGVFEHIDTTLFVSGWAIDRNQPDSPVRVDIELDDIPITSAVTDLIRPDLIVAGISGARSGFKIPIPPGAISKLKHDVSLKVGGSALEGGPKSLDWVAAASLSIQPGQSGTIKVTLQGWPGEKITTLLAVNTEIVAELELKTDSREGSLSGCWPIPSEIEKNNKKNVYQAKIYVDDNIEILSNLIIHQAHEYKINIDTIDADSISGWILKKHDENPVCIDVYFNGSKISSAKADRPRPDVQKEFGLLDSLHGFTIKLPKVRSSITELELRDGRSGGLIGLARIGYKYEIFGALSRAATSANGLYENVGIDSLLSPLSLKSQDEKICSLVTSSQLHLPRGRGLDVIIPVYAGAMETAECIQSVFSAKNVTDYRVFIVNDASPDPLIRQYLRSLEKKNIPNTIIIKNPENKGFSESVNFAIVASQDRDVILLNSDTVVQDYWIDRLVAAAENSADIGTVTPLSNNGEICSFPYNCKSTAVLSSVIAKTVDEVAARTNARKIADIPVGIGFCMLIRRECINDVGLFDAQKWGRGYGEEVDFCLKAFSRGWKNIMAADVFVVHRGGASFGEEKKLLVLENSKKVAKLYPFYDSMIARFISNDPLRSIRRSLSISLLEQALAPKKILHVVHSLGGGTEKYVNDLSTMIAQEHCASVIARCRPDGSLNVLFDSTKTSLEGLFDSIHEEEYEPGEIDEFLLDMQRLNFTKIHLHSPLYAPEDLLKWVQSHNAYDITIHDYAWSCPRVHLYKDDGRHCGENLDTCDTCVSAHGPHSGAEALLSAFSWNVANYRSFFRQVFAGALTVYCGADDVKSRLINHGFEANFKIIPHPKGWDTIENLYDKPIESETVVVGIFGAISDIKGYHALIEIFNSARAKKDITFVIFGYTMKDIVLKDMGNVRVLGAYREENLESLIKENKPEIALFLNQVPETFSYTLSHCFSIGLWPVVTDIGAPAERVRAADFGTVIPLDTPPADVAKIIIDTAKNNRLKKPKNPRIQFPKNLREYGYKIAGIDLPINENQ